MSLEKRLELLEHRQREIESKLNEILEVWNLVEDSPILDFGNMSEEDEKSLKDFMDHYFGGNATDSDCIGAPC